MPVGAAQEQNFHAKVKWQLRRRGTWGRIYQFPVASDTVSDFNGAKKRVRGIFCPNGTGPIKRLGGWEGAGREKGGEKTDLLIRGGGTRGIEEGETGQDKRAATWASGSD